MFFWFHAEKSRFRFSVLRRKPKFNQSCLFFEQGQAKIQLALGCRQGGGQRSSVQGKQAMGGQSLKLPWEVREHEKLWLENAQLYRTGLLAILHQRKRPLQR